MNDLLLFLTSKEIMIVYILIGVITALAIIVWLVERRVYKRKLRNNTKELNKLVSDVEERLEEEITIENPPVLETQNIVDDKVEEIETIQVIEPKKEEIVYEEIEDEKAYAQEEIRKITESLIDTDDKKSETDVIALTKFEEEQEKNSIISIDELMQHSKELYNSDIIKEYEDESNVLISLSEFEKLKENGQKQEVKEVVPLTIVKEEDIRPNIVEEKKPKLFKSSPVISPIYGLEKEENIKDNNIMSLENSATYDKFDDEMRKTNEFLNTLKELQKKLD